MAELKILRVEVSSIDTESDSLNPNEQQGDVLTEQETKKDELRSRSMKNKTFDSRYGGMFFGKEMLEELDEAEDAGLAPKNPAKQNKLKDGLKASKGLGVSALGVVSTGYSLYSAYKVAGYEMSGASAAAARQQRKGNVANMAIAGVVAAAINPALLPLTVAYKAYELAQTNRRELFDINKSRVLSQIESQNLVRNTIERRF